MIGDAPLLSHLLVRVRRAETVDDWVVATSTRTEDDVVARLAEMAGVKVFRGAEEDVLDRFLGVARWTDADVLVRVTGDSPLVEQTIIDQAVRAHLDRNVDYTGAKDVQEFPLGTGCEVISRAALEKAWTEGRSPEDREHVTYYVLAYPERFKLQFLRNDAAWRGLPVRLVVDEPPDLRLIREVFARLAPTNACFGMREVLNLYQQAPELFAINVAVEERSTSFLAMRRPSA